MALTITHLAGPSSFLLTLEPLDTSPAALSTPAFTILLDPVLPVLPTADLVLISARRHCHEPTLRRLPSRSSILAVPAAARRIRRWRHFDAAVVGTLPRWDDSSSSSSSSSSSVLKIPVLSRARQGSSEAGEITLTCIGRRHAAIGITYRPPTATRRWWCAVGGCGGGPTLMLPPPPPPPLPTPALSFSSSSGDSSSPGDSPVSGPTSPPRRRRRRRRRLSTLLPPSDRGISILFAPRGISSHRAFQSYATTHLLEQAVLPLTALLHRFDDPSAPRFLSPPSGHATASALGARAWISAHTGEEAGKSAEEVQRALDENGAGRRHQTEVRALAPGEELTMTSEGIWEEESLFAELDGGKDQPGRLFGLGLDIGVDEDGRILGGALPVDWIDAVGSSSSVRMVQG